MTAFHKASLPCAIATALAVAVGVLARPAAAVEEIRLSPRLVNHSTSTLDATIIASDSLRLESTAIAKIDPRDPALVRLESAWIWQPEQSTLRVKLGDSTSNPGMWGSAVRFAGLQLGTPFEVRQDLLYAPRLALAGMAVVPTAADALLATARAPGVQLGRRGLSTGRPTPGLNGLAFTAYDAAGGSTSLNRQLVAAPRRLEPGCSSYTLSLGRVRENYGLETDSYGPWFANTTLACGLEGGRTIEAHGEFLAGHAAIAGLTLSQPISSHATAALTAVTSENELGTGYSLQFGLQRELHRVSVGLQARVQTPEFRDLGSDVMDDGIAQRMLASIAARLNDRAVLALAYAMQRTFSYERTDVIGLSQTLRFRGGSLALGANRAINDEGFSSVNLSFSRALFY